jgi:hypothetical protein
LEFLDGLQGLLLLEVLLQKIVVADQLRLVVEVLILDDVHQTSVLNLHFHKGFGYLQLLLLALD